MRKLAANTRRYLLKRVVNDVVGMAQVVARKTHALPEKGQLSSLDIEIRCNMFCENKYGIVIGSRHRV